LAQVDNTFGDVDYDRYIDGVSLDGISTQWLDLTWETYAFLFPEDNDAIVTRTLMVTATDQLWVSSDTASVSIVYESICGDGILMSTEECDDGNLVVGDGCSEQCMCEGMCTSLLMRSRE
jgi:cysteine-rich repeat protein